MLARQALIIEEHYQRPDGHRVGQATAPPATIYILQARPETVQSRAGRTIQRYALKGTLAGARHRPQHRPAHRRRHRRA